MRMEPRIIRKYTSSCPLTAWPLPPRTDGPAACVFLSSALWCTFFHSRLPPLPLCFLCKTHVPSRAILHWHLSSCTACVFPFVHPLFHMLSCLHPGPPLHVVLSLASISVCGSLLRVVPFIQRGECSRGPLPVCCRYPASGIVPGSPCLLAPIPMVCAPVLCVSPYSEHCHFRGYLACLTSTTVQCYHWQCR